MQTWGWGGVRWGRQSLGLGPRENAPAGATAMPTVGRTAPLRETHKEPHSCPTPTNYSQYINCNCSLKLLYFPCFHYRVWKFSKKPNEKVIALMQANGQCLSPHRDTSPVWCTKNHSANELILIVLISKQPQWACILGDKMCFWSLVLIPEIKGNKRLPQRQISQVILWPKKHFL